MYKITINGVCCIKTVDKKVLKICPPIKVCQTSITQKLEIDLPFPFLILLDREGEESFQEQQERGQGQIPITSVSFEYSDLPDGYDAMACEDEPGDDGFNCG